VSPVRYELGFYIPEDGILHSHRRENLKSYRIGPCLRTKVPREDTEGILPPKRCVLNKAPDMNNVQNYDTYKIIN
jgi:hypothetical protein